MTGIPFEIMINEKKEAKWRDLMGPEKHVLQKNSIPTLFPELGKAEEMQKSGLSSFTCTNGFVLNHSLQMKSTTYKQISSNG